jgi:hypothetical protein
MIHHRQSRYLNPKKIFLLIFIFRVYFDTMMFIFNNGHIHAQYAFNQWLGHETQAENITKGLEVLIYFLEALREYFVSKTLLKTLNTSIFCAILDKNKF